MAKPAAKVTACCSAIPTSKDLSGNFFSNKLIPVPEGIAPVIPTILVSCSACLTKVSAKPLDEKLIIELASNHEVVIKIEEGSIGGFGSHVMQFLSERGVFDRGLKFRSMILPDIFIDQDTPEKMYETAGLDSLSIANKVEETLNSNIILAKNKNKISN